MLFILPRLCRQHLRSYVQSHIRQLTTGQPNVCIVGAGPAGFYTAQQILKGNPNAVIDIYEKLPVPFGLVRYGVAPDHPEVKNVINTFTQTASKDRCTFIGNVTIGKDISIADLQKAYSAVVLSYGADNDRLLGVPGENLKNVISARSFVGWYNGLPQDIDLQVNLDVEKAVIIGHGNVALDVARILLMPIDLLKKTDISQHSLDALSKSRIKEVIVIGRRGPLQVAFTIKELREMIRLPDCKPVLSQADFIGVDKLIQDLPRPRRRLTELMYKTCMEPTDKDLKLWETAQKSWSLSFCMSPLEIFGDKDVTGLKLGINKLQGEDLVKQSAILTDQTVDMSCGLKIQNCISFRQEAVTNLIKFRDGYQQSKKRMANFSPDLDLSAAVAVHADTSVEDSLQLCIIPGPSVKEDRAKSKDEDFSQLYSEHDYSRQLSSGHFNIPIELQKPSNNLDNEHGYTRPRTNGKAVCKELFPVPINRDVPDLSVKPINVNKNFLKVISNECMHVSTKRQGEQSVLMRKKSMESLADENTDMTREILEEMKDRTPSLLEMLEATFVKQHNETDDEKIKEAIALVYGVIMFTRNPELSAYQRLITALCIRGRAEDMLLSRLNKIGLTLSTASKQRLIADCGKNSNKKLIDYLEGSPLLKITGDNLDIFIKPSCQSTEKSNYDLHLFASNAISCRATTPDLNMSAPKDVGPLNSDIVRLTDTEKDHIRNSYIVLISRILSSMGPFKWMESIIPKHIHHPHKAAMAEKSQVFQLPLQHKNEAKYEDVLSIMDDYEKLLQKAFRDAHGDTQMLEKYRVITGGDQLTKVRFAGAINLRLMSPTSTGRLEHVQPVVCEMWHLKQDYLEKCYKALYRKESMAEEGTMSYFRNVLKKNDVNGKVKGHFKTHSEFFKILTESLIREQALELFNLNETSDDTFPSGIDKACRATKEVAMRNIGNSLLDMLGFLQAGMTTDDEKFNYCSNLCLRGLHYLQLEDTAKEGNLTMVSPNLKICIPIFYQHSCLSKYMVECIDYLMKVNHYMSPLDSLRILEGSFVNLRGGAGNNVEADLVQEHSVRNQKDLIRGLGANKSENAISTVTAAAPIITSICRNFDSQHDIIKKGNRHTKHISEEDVNILKKSLRKLRPFKVTVGRKCRSFNNITNSPAGRVDVIKMEIDINRIVERLGRGLDQNDDNEDEDDDYDDDDEDTDSDLPDIP